MTRAKKIGSKVFGYLTLMALLTSCSVTRAKKLEITEPVADYVLITTTSKGEVGEVKPGDSDRSIEVEDGTSDDTAVLPDRIQISTHSNDTESSTSLNDYCRATVTATIQKDGVWLVLGKEYFITGSSSGQVTLVVEQKYGSFELITVDQGQWWSSCTAAHMNDARRKNVFIKESILLTSQNGENDGNCTIKAGTVIRGNMAVVYFAQFGSRFTADMLLKLCGTDTVYSSSQIPIFALIPGGS